MNTLDKKRVKVPYISDPDYFEEHIYMIRMAGVPECFNKKFLDGLGFSEPESYLFVGLFSSLRLIDEKGCPMFDYYIFIQSDTASRKILAKKMKKCYKKLFSDYEKAHTMSPEKAREYFNNELKGDKPKEIIRKIADTYSVLAGYAIWQDVDDEISERKNGNNKKEFTQKEFLDELMNGNTNHEYEPIVEDEPRLEVREVNLPDHLAKGKADQAESNSESIFSHPMNEDPGVEYSVMDYDEDELVCEMLAEDLAHEEVSQVEDLVETEQESDVDSESISNLQKEPESDVKAEVIYEKNTDRQDEESDKSKVTIANGKDNNSKYIARQETSPGSKSRATSKKEEKPEVGKQPTFIYDEDESSKAASQINSNPEEKHMEMFSSASENAQHEQKTGSESEISYELMVMTEYEKQLAKALNKKASLLQRLSKYEDAVDVYDQIILSNQRILNNIRTNGDFPVSD